MGGTIPTNGFRGQRHPLCKDSSSKKPSVVEEACSWSAPTSAWSSALPGLSTVLSMPAGLAAIHAQYRSIQIDYRQTLILGGINFQLQIQNHAARRIALKTLTSLNKEVRPFFLSDNSIWSYQRLQHLEVLKAILALRPKHMEHFNSLSPNTIIA